MACFYRFTCDMSGTRALAGVSYHSTDSEGRNTPSGTHTPAGDSRSESCEDTRSKGELHRDCSLREPRSAHVRAGGLGRSGSCLSLPVSSSKQLMSTLVTAQIRRSSCGLYGIWEWPIYSTIISAPSSLTWTHSCAHVGDAGARGLIVSLIHPTVAQRQDCAPSSLTTSRMRLC
ncbi:hypothetical protein MRB53_041288 [Persea americana]|nr:hypothetical protein MRB53_041288 [Persea americana]